MRAAVASWLTDESSRTPVELAEESFDRGRPALEAILELPTAETRVTAA